MIRRLFRFRTPPWDGETKKEYVLEPVHLPACRRCSRRLIYPIILARASESMLMANGGVGNPSAMLVRLVSWFFGEIYYYLVSRRRDPGRKRRPRVPRRWPRRRRRCRTSAIAVCGAAHRVIGRPTRLRPVPEPRYRSRSLPTVGERSIGSGICGHQRPSRNSSLLSRSGYNLGQPRTEPSRAPRR